jgi:hypothetical protein
MLLAAAAYRQPSPLTAVDARQPRRILVRARWRRIRADDGIFFRGEPAGNVIGISYGCAAKNGFIPVTCSRPDVGRKTPSLNGEPLKDCPAGCWGAPGGANISLRMPPCEKGTPTISDCELPSRCGAERNLWCGRENTAPEAITDYRLPGSGYGGRR